MRSDRRGGLYCESLTVRTFVGTVLPIVVRDRSIRTCWYVDATRPAAALARVICRLRHVAVTRLDFRLVDVRDAEGRLIRLRIAFVDLEQVQQAAITQSVFTDFVEAAGLDQIQTEYLAKCVGAISLSDNATLWRALLLIQVAAWHAQGSGEDQVRLVIERRPWHAVIADYGRRSGVVVEAVTPAFRPAALVRRVLGPTGLARIRKWRDTVGHIVFLRKHGASISSAVCPAPVPASGGVGASRMPAMAVESFGHFNLDAPGQHSDLFFWQESSLEGQNLLVTFVAPQDPLTPERHRQLQAHGIRAVALYPGASSAVEVPIFTHAPVHRARRVHAAGGVPNAATREWRWMEERLDNFEVLREYWGDFFETFDVRAYLTWYRFDERIYPIAAALRRRGGVTAIYQRSFQIDPSPEMAADVDVMFGFSPMDADVERRSGSRIDYHVAVGYVGDHRADHQRAAAAQIRRALEACGAQRVLAYFDENSAEDSRWHTGHEFMRDNYIAVLEQVLRDPALGLVLKPKHPSSLRRRLGPVASLLDEAIATGRCVMCDAGSMHGSDPPVLAALAADLVIHGHLCGSTAGFEAALAGVPTLLLDREGWPCSPMYELGPGTVVFTDWKTLWRAVESHFSAAGSPDRFGRWEPLIHRYDPFRDGGAAGRIGDFMAAVMAGLRAGRGRDAVLGEVAEAYASRWGADKITRVGDRRSTPFQGPRVAAGAGLHPAEA